METCKHKQIVGCIADLPSLNAFGALDLMTDNKLLDCLFDRV